MWSKGEARTLYETDLAEAEENARTWKQHVKSKLPADGATVGTRKGSETGAMGATSSPPFRGQRAPRKSDSYYRVLAEHGLSRPKPKRG